MAKMGELEEVTGNPSTPQDDEDDEERDLPLQINADNLDKICAERYVSNQPSLFARRPAHGNHAHVLHPSNLGSDPQLLPTTFDPLHVPPLLAGCSGCCRQEAGRSLRASSTDDMSVWVRSPGVSNQPGHGHRRSRRRCAHLRPACCPRAPFCDLQPPLPGTRTCSPRSTTDLDSRRLQALFLSRSRRQRRLDRRRRRRRRRRRHRRACHRRFAASVRRSAPSELCAPRGRCCTARFAGASTAAIFSRRRRCRPAATATVVAAVAAPLVLGVAATDSGSAAGVCAELSPRTRRRARALQRCGGLG